MSPNHREALTAVSSISSTDEYVYSTSHALDVNVVAGGGSGTQYTEGATTSPGVGNLSLGRYSSTPPSLTNGQMSALQVDTSGNLLVSGSLSVGGTTDNSAFTAGTSTGTPAMGFYHSTIDTVTDGRAAAVGITSKRALLVNLQTAAGAETGIAALPLQVSLANTASNATAVKVDGTGGTFPVSGTVAVSSITTSVTPGTAATNLGKAEDAGHTTGDVGVMALGVRNDAGTALATTTLDYIPITTDEVGATWMATNGRISSANSTTANLSGGAAFTGTSEEVKNYAAIQVSVFSSHASATDGLSLQQSSDATNWDITDTYSIPATTGKVFSVQPAARYFRLVYTNGATLTTSLRIQTVYHTIAPNASSQRASDAYTNETDLTQQWVFNSIFNGTTWDRVREATNATNTTGTGITASANLAQFDDVAPTSITENQFGNMRMSANRNLYGTIRDAAGNERGVNVTASNALQIDTTSVAGTATAVNNGGVSNGTQRVTIANDSTGVLASITSSVTPGTAATNLGKAEDAVHTTGDVGVMALAVRNDNASTTFGANGDYYPKSVDLGGRQIIAQKAATGTVTSVADTNTNTTLLAANSARLGAIIYNDSTVTLYVKYGATATTSDYTVLMVAQAYHEVPFGYTGILDGIWASNASGAAKITEMT